MFILFIRVYRSLQMYPNISHVAGVYGVKRAKALDMVNHINKHHKEALQDILKLAGAMRLNEYINNNYIKKDAEGFTGWRWEKHNVTLVIVSAANRYGDIVFCAPRHGGPAMAQNILAFGGIQTLNDYAGEGNSQQGFVDQYGTFYDRKEAYLIAKRNNQIISNGGLGTTPGTLYSEDLY